MGLFRSLSGILRVEWVCADIPGLMDALNNMEIPIDLVQQRDEVTLCFTISRRQLPKMQKLSIKRSESFRIIEKEGLFYDFQRVLRRRVLVTGMLLLLLAVICIPGRVDRKSVV